MKIEQRRYQDYPEAMQELRAGGSGQQRTITGLGAPYGVWSQDLGGFRERFEAGALRESIASDDIRALYNHDSGKVLGRVSAKTLRLSETERGVEYEVDLPDTSFARDLVVSIERRDVTGNSFGFAIPDGDAGQRWEERDGILWRTVTRAKMFELGPQPFPAYEQTEVQSRSIRSVVEEGVRWMRSRGMSVDVALRLLELDEDDAALIL